MDPRQDRRGRIPLGLSRLFPFSHVFEFPICRTLGQGGGVVNRFTVSELKEARKEFKDVLEAFSKQGI